MTHCKKLCHILTTEIYGTDDGDVSFMRDKFNVLMHWSHIIFAYMYTYSFGFKFNQIYLKKEQTKKINKIPTIQLLQWVKNNIICLIFRACEKRKGQRGTDNKTRKFNSGHNSKYGKNTHIRTVEPVNCWTEQEFEHKKNSSNDSHRPWIANVLSHHVWCHASHLL